MPACIRVKALVADVVGDELAVSVEERGASRVLVIRGASDRGESFWFDKSQAAALGALISNMADDLDEVD